MRFLFPCLAFLAIAALHAESRVWTSKDGTATMTATFHKVDGEKVTLILSNGRSQVVERKFLSEADDRWITDHASTSSASASPTSSRMSAALEGKLIDDHGKPVSLTAEGKAPKYYLFYYSASWCGPCHAFTPELVRFYRKMKGRNADFEVILHPSDRSADDEIAYMKEMRMPWPALAYDQRTSSGVPRNKWGYIPSMVLVDADGTQLLQVNEDLSRDEFLKKTEIILKGGTATAQN